MPCYGRLVSINKVYVRQGQHPEESNISSKFCIRVSTCWDFVWKTKDFASKAVWLSGWEKKESLGKWGGGWFVKVTMGGWTITLPPPNDVEHGKRNESLNAMRKQPGCEVERGTSISSSSQKETTTAKTTSTTTTITTATTATTTTTTTTNIGGQGQKGQDWQERQDRQGEEAVRWMYMEFWPWYSSDIRHKINLFLVPPAPVVRQHNALVATSAARFWNFQPTFRDFLLDPFRSGDPSISLEVERGVTRKRKAALHREAKSRVLREHGFHASKVRQWFCLARFDFPPHQCVSDKFTNWSSPKGAFQD